MSHFNIIVSLKVTENQGWMFHSFKNTLRDKTVVSNVFNCVAAYIGVNDNILKRLNKMFIKFLMNLCAGLMQGVAPIRVSHWVFKYSI